MTAGLVLDGTLIVLLAATLGYCTLLYRRLAELRTTQASMKKLIGEFGAATERAQAGLLSIASRLEQSADDEDPGPAIEAAATELQSLRQSCS